MKTYGLLEAIKKTMEDNGHSSWFVGNFTGLPNYTIYRIYQGMAKYVTPKTAEKLWVYLDAFCKVKVKVKSDEVMDSGLHNLGRRKIPGQSLAQCSQRPGIAHLCVNGILICGEQDIHNVRYYRAHEEFLNQVEICPTCKKSFLDAVTLWSANQPKKGK